LTPKIGVVTFGQTGRSFLEDGGMAKSVQLTATWPSGRSVPVNVVIKPLAGSRGLDGPVNGPKWIDRGDLATIDTLVVFLKELTRTARARELREAYCLEINEDDLYKVLEYEPGGPQPIEVQMIDG
jgi:hypothetical protein